MKKSFLSLLLVLMTTVLYAGKEELYVLYEGFENGIPATWSQINEAGQQQWIIESATDAQYPTGVVEGEYRAALRNTTTQTQHFVTKLVTPVFDISKTVHPILMFSHAQAQRTGDVDQLKVYYRQSATDRWIEIASFENKITNWTQETIQLPGACETYQLAFEGTDNLGRGIVLDEIIVRPEPTCEDPFNISADELTPNSVVLRWNGSLDTEKFRVVLSTKEITDIEQPQGVVMDSLVADFELAINKLDQNTTYYAYIQAQCSMETTEWNGISFTTKNIVDLPYYQSFNLNYQSGYTNRVKYWSYGNSIRKDEGFAYSPFVNTNTATSDLFRYSVTSTTSLVFAGTNSVSTVIPAGEYVYAATPELKVNNLKNVIVRFWGTANTYFNAEKYVSGLIVGVMTNPSDYSTFVPMDTVYSTSTMKHEYYEISMESYDGEGKYIAFASDFKEKDNIYYLDEVQILEKPVVGRPANVDVKNVTSNSLEVVAYAEGATKYNVMISTDFSFTAEPEKVIYKAEGLTDKLLINTDTITGKAIQIYVQGANSDTTGEWSFPMVYYIPRKIEKYPTVISFEDSEGLRNRDSYYNYHGISGSANISCNTTFRPYILNKVPLTYTQSTEPIAGKVLWTYTGNYISFPEVDDVKNTQMSFYMRAYYSSASMGDGESKLTVGVMTDPYDSTTFVPMATFDGDYSAWTYCVVPFMNYTGEGKFIAIRADEAPKAPYGEINSVIDLVTIKELGNCIDPSGIQTKATTDSSATISWTANGMTKWRVQLTDSVKVEVKTGSEGEFQKFVYTPWFDATRIIIDTIVETNTPTLKGLFPHSYYGYRVATVCDTTIFDDLKFTFRTQPSSPEHIPYVEDFERYMPNNSGAQVIPDGWTMPLYKYITSGGSYSTTSYYPYITSGSTTAHQGTASLQFGSINLAQSMYFALPQLKEAVNQLQLSFYMKAASAAYAGDTILVGVMSDPSDLATFDTVALVKTTVAYSEYIIRFAKYVGDGKYIALIKKGEEKHYFYLDDIKVDYLAECEKVQGVTATNANEIGATISWNKGDATQWEIVVANKELTVDEIAAQDIAIVKDSVTSENPFVVDFCDETNKAYYVYVRALCGDDNKGDWSNVMTFKTTCVPKTPEGYGFIDFAKDGFGTSEFPCWTVGKREGTTVNPSITAGSHLYMFNTTASEGAYAIMPPIDVDDISKLQVKFTAAGGTGTAYLRELTVGIITNPSDLSTFEAIETVKLPLVATSPSKANHAKNLDEAQTYIVRFNEYAGDYEGNFGKQIMFLSENGGVANYVYIYSMQVDSIPSCLEPLKVEEVEVNTYDATMGWDTISTSYQVQLLADDKVTVLVDSITDKQQMKFEGLTMLTKYYVQVRTICAVGDTSAWSPMGNFTTQCPVAYELPYEENFDSYTAKTTAPRVEPNCWTTWYDGQDAVTATTAYCYIYATAKKGTSGNGFYMGSTTGNAAGTTPAKQSVAVLPAINGLKTALLHFNVKAQSTTGTRALKIGVAEYAEPYDSILSTVVWIDSVENIVGADWAYYTFDLSAYQGVGKNIVMMNYGGNTSTTTLSTTAQYVYIDDIYVEKMPSCFRPIDLTFASATASSITLTWTPQGNETAWDIACLPAGEEDMTKASIITVSGDGPKATVTGLSNDTKYDFYVRANCGEGDNSEWSSVVTASTLVLVELANAQWNFDNYQTRERAPLSTSDSYLNEHGWLIFNPLYTTSYSYQPYIGFNAYNSTTKTYSSRYAYSDSCYFRIGCTTAGKNQAYVVLPQVNADNKDLQIRFMARDVYDSYGTSGTTAGEWTKYTNTYASGSYVHTVKVGTMTDPYDYSTFDEIGVYILPEVLANCTTQVVEGDYWQEITVPLFAGEGKFIAISAADDKANLIYVDNVVVEPVSGCTAPVKLQTIDSLMTYYGAGFEWKSNNAKWNIRITSDEQTIETSVSECKFAIDTLQPQTTYTFAVQSDCGSGETSDWATLTFTTPCAPIEEEQAKWNFEENLYQYGTSATYLIPECWDVNYLGGTTLNSQLYIPYALKNTTTKIVARGEYDVNKRALQFYCTTSYWDAYAMLPVLDEPMDSLVLHFYYRAAYSSSSSTKKMVANSAYVKDLVVGYVEDGDINTFVPMQTVNYSLTTTTSNIYNDRDDYYWEEAAVSLAGFASEKKNRQIVLRYCQNKPTATTYFYVDDMEIVKGSFCLNVTNVKVTDITSHSAKLTWQVEDPSPVELVLTKNNGKDIEDWDFVLDTIIHDTTVFLAENLSAGVDYAYSFRHLCSDEDQSAWSDVRSFLVNYDIRFTENFSTQRTFPVDWTRYYSTLADSAFNGVALKEASESLTYGWKQGGDRLFTTTNTSTSTYTSWILTPIISLVEVEQPTMLSFNLAINSSDGTAPTRGSYDEFMILVTDDAGKTWKKENSWSWGNDPEKTYDYVYDNIAQGPEGSTILLDMTKFNGKSIQIAIYSNAPKTNSKNTISIDNFQVNTYEKNEYSAQICQYNDYEDDNFFIDANDLIVDKTTVYTKYDAATKDGVNDTYTQLSLTVNCAVTTTKSVTLCEGENYLEDNFAIYNVVESATYKQKLEAASGCDSISEVVITVLPRIYNIVEKTICQGDFFEFGGVKYYTSTIVSDTVPSLVTSCDSITTLYLTVNAILAGTTETDLCEGDTIVFGKYTITEGGTYVDTLKNALGCDSVATLVVTMRENYATMKRAAICQGEKYSDDVFQGLGQAGDYPSEQKSIYGCDSIVTLHLLVANEDLKLEDKIEVDELPYIINGQELLPIGTVEGSYQRTIDLNCGMATITILVGNVSALPQVKVDDLTVNPNPVQVGEAFYVSGPFAGNATMTIVNANGQNIYTATGVQSPVVVPGLPVTGVYMITITSTNGTYATKVMAY